MRSYIYSTVLLIALGFVVLSCSNNKSNISFGKPSMVGIIGKGGNGDAKLREIQDYLKGKYKVGEKGVFADSLNDGSIKKISFSGDFTPPGYVRKEYVHEDIRACSRAFLEEERELFGLTDLENELKAGEVMIERNSEYPVFRFIVYHIEVEGLWVSGSAFIFVFTENAEPAVMKANPRLVSPAMRGAAKRYRAEGLTAADIKEAVRADLVKKGLPQANIDGLGFGPEFEIFIVDEKPYVISVRRFSYPKHGDDSGEWTYHFNAITGEIIERIYTSDPNINYDD